MRRRVIIRWIQALLIIAVARVVLGEGTVYSQVAPNEDAQSRARLVSLLNAKPSEITTMRVEFDLYRAQDVAMNPSELERLLLDGVATESAEQTFATIQERLDKSGSRKQAHNSRFIWDGARRLEDTYGTIAVDDGLGLIRKSEVNRQITVGTRTHLPYKTLHLHDFRQSLRPEWLEAAENRGPSTGGILFSNDLSDFTIDPVTALSRMAVKRGADGNIIKLYSEIGTNEPKPGIFLATLVVDAVYKDANTIKLLSAILVKNVVVNEPVDKSIFVVRADEGTLYFDVTEGVHPEKAFPVAAVDDIRKGVTKTEGKVASASLLSSGRFRAELLWINIAFVVIVVTVFVFRNRRAKSAEDSAK